MFCKNCGQKLTENDKFCPSCGTNLSSEPTVQVNTADTYDVDNNSAPAKIETVNYNGCITAFVLALIGSFVAEIGLVIMFSVSASVVYSYGAMAPVIDDSLVVVSYVFGFIALGLLIPALILGIKSITFAKRAKAEGKKSVKTLVFGIISTVISSLSLFYVLIIFLSGVNYL